MITLDALEIDAVREFVNIASGNAASALAQLLGQRTMIEVPRFRCAQIDDIAEVLFPAANPPSWSQRSYSAT